MQIPLISSVVSGVFLSGFSRLHGALFAQEPKLSNANFVGTSFGIPAISANAAFDYVVIGGGTAGLTVATRLAENASISVAVIEAGGFYEVDNGNLSVIPSNALWFAGADANDYNPLIDWGFLTSEQEGLAGRRLHYARGKCLGGSSARNVMIYQRGTTDSYSLWANAVDDSSYEFPSLLKYFQRSVEFTPANNALRASNASVTYDPAAFSSLGGPLQVSVPNYAIPFSSWSLLGLAQIGIQRIGDFVSGALLGAQYTMTTVDPRDSTRSSSEASYLRQALGRPNLQVYKNSMAQRILFGSDTGTPKASGVLVNTSGLLYTLEARREVILSAGAFQSPQMLLVSGIGPRSTLDELDIPLIAERPGVGQNLWDHFLFGPNYQVDLITHSSLGNAAFRAAETEKYLKDQTGMIGNSGADLLAWEKLPDPERQALSDTTLTALSSFPGDWPEIEYIFFDAYSGNQQNYITGAPQTPDQYVGVISALVSPLSRGNVTIGSSNMADPPIINPNWLSDPADQELAVAAFKRARQLMDTDSMSSITVGAEVYPGRNVSSDADILDFIKQTGNTVWHAAATCKMGRANDTMAVVDSHARVFGVDGLRVVDASAFPLLPPGHPQATVYALAEKIAEDIQDGL